MGYANYVGRVGALAVALGIGTAVASAPVVSADTGSTKSTTSSSAHKKPATAGNKSNATEKTTPQGRSGAAPAVTPGLRDPDTTPRAQRNTATSAHSAATTLHTNTVDEASTPAPPAVAAVAPQASSGPEATVTVVTVTPGPAQPPLARQLVLGVLGIFGFDPTPGTPNNPILEGLWGAYRRIESLVSNETPTVGSAQVIGTSLTEDGHTAVNLSVDISDYDGDALTVTTADGANGTLTRNGDGTFTYLTDADFSGTDTVTITANDAGPHLHGLLSLFAPDGGHAVVASLAIGVVAQPVPVIDSAVATPTGGSTWTLTVHTNNDANQLTVTTDQPDHVSITPTGTYGVYTVTADAGWLASTPGTFAVTTAATNYRGTVTTTTAIPTNAPTHAPVINSVTVTPTSSNTWTVTVNATDAQQITVTSGAPGATVTGSGGVYTITAPPTWSTFTVTTTANNYLGSATTTTLIVRPVPTQPPVINSVTITPTSSNTWTVTVNATDAQQITVTTGAPDATVTGSGGVYTITAPPTWSTFTVTTTAGNQLGTTTDLTVISRPVPTQPPVINSAVAAAAGTNRWNLTVNTTDAQAINVTTDQPDHVTVTGGGSAVWLVAAEPVWAASHPGPLTIVTAATNALGTTTATTTVLITDQAVV